MAKLDQYAAFIGSGGFRRGVQALATMTRWRCLLASLASLLLNSVVADLGWAQPCDGEPCPAGKHCFIPTLGKPGHCVNNPTRPSTIFVNWQNSGLQDGTAAHPYQTLPPALAVAAPGDTIAIRTGSYNLEGGLFNKKATIRADNGLVTIGSSSPIWFDAQTGKPAPHPAPYDLVTRAFDDNGIPFNPMLGSQTWSPPQLAAPALCGQVDDHLWEPPCTTQRTWINNNTGLCLPRAPLSPGPLGGHANWMLATYEGKLFWADHSYYLFDDDYSLALYRDDLAGITEVDVAKQEYLHSEFNSNQTINYFHTWYWDTLHQAVDSDGGKGGTRHGPWPQTHPLVDGKEAIVMGLFGLDCAHECGSELHPVYAMAIHLSDSLDDDVWAIFVRNWGDEGYCSSFGKQEEISPGQPFTFTFRFRRPGASDVRLVPAAASDKAGQHGTVFHSDHGAPGTGWSTPTLVSDEGAVMTFTLPPPKQREQFNGMLHLKWSVSGPRASAAARLVERPADFRPEISPEPDEPEGRLRELITQMTPAQKQKFFGKLGGEGPPPLKPHTPVPLPMQAAPPPGARQGPPPQVQQVPDSQREQRDRQLLEAFRAVYGDRFPLSPPH